MKLDAETRKRRLAGWLVNKVEGARDVEITSWSTSPTGQSNETIFFDARWIGDGVRREERLVLRMPAVDYQLFLDADVLLQWRMMEALARHPTVPVPPLRWLETDAAVLGAPFFLMARVEGRVPPDIAAHQPDNYVIELAPNERAQLCRNGLEVMARLHGIDWRPDFAFLDQPRRGRAGLDQYLSWVEDWYAWSAHGRSFPIIEAGLRHLRKNQPVEPEVRVVWGDARLGNMILAEDHSVRAVLDWEMAALGPPEVDLGWWIVWEHIWTVESGVDALEGILSRVVTLAAYERLLGRPIESFEYYEVLAAVRAALIFLRGIDKRIEFGVMPPTTRLGADNVASRFLARRLGLPLPEVGDDIKTAAAEVGKRTNPALQGDR
ncbi:MAG: phosphotransferase family protein [Candidatus Binatia bacterium]